MKKRSIAALGALALAVGFGRLQAQEAQVTSSGFVDVYYQYNGSGTSSPGVVPNRVFDVSNNTFRTALVQYGLSVQQGKTGGSLQLIFGETADILAGVNTEIAFKQAYVTYQPTEKVTLTMGKFVTHMGYEVIQSIDNLNYTRSYIFGWTIPFDHTGVKANIALSDQYSAMVGILNTGWNSEASANSDKTIGLQFAGNPLKKFGFVLSAIYGDEDGPPTADQYKKAVVNGILNVNATEKLYLGLDLTYGQDTAPSTIPDETDVMRYTGVAGYARYAIDEKWSLAARVEHLADRENVTGIGIPMVQGATLTLAWKKDALTVKFEGRYDEALDIDGNKVAGFFGDPNDTTQRTVTLGAVLSF